MIATRETTVAEPCSRIVTITNRLGLHARPAMMFAQAAGKYGAAVTVRRLDQGDAVDGKSIMEMMMLVATFGTELEVSADGDDAEDALKELCELVESNFREE